VGRRILNNQILINNGIPRFFSKELHGEKFQTVLEGRKYKKRINPKKGSEFHSNVICEMKLHILKI
jgi:hypothetical protein